MTENKNPDIIDTADGAVCCILCHYENRSPWLCHQCSRPLRATRICYRVRRGKRVEVPSRWVGVLTTQKTKRQRKSEARAKRLKTHMGRHLMTKAAVRREGKTTCSKPDLED